LDEFGEIIAVRPKRARADLGDKPAHDNIFAKRLDRIRPSIVVSRFGEPHDNFLTL